MTGRSLNGSRYGLVARKAAGVQDSGVCKPAGNVEVVINVTHEGRERKLRSTKMKMTGRRMEKLLGILERPKGRGRRKGRKGKACKERRKESRRQKRSEKEGREGCRLEVEEERKTAPRTEWKLSGAAKEFSPARTRSGRLFRPSAVGPPLPADPFH